jgi:hypothetical protein
VEYVEGSKENMNWLNIPLEEFVKVPYDEINAGCHITPERLMCWNILPSNELYKAVDFTVPIVSNAGIIRDMESLILGVIYLLILCFVASKESTCE